MAPTVTKGYDDVPDELMLLTDVSVNVQLNIGYGAYLAMTEGEHSLDLLRTRIKVQRFENTTSTKLELQTIMWALGDIQLPVSRIIVYTDSQNVIGLQQRRERFEQNNYRSKKNRVHNNQQLYQEFYRTTDQIPCSFVKVRGHQKSNQKEAIDKIFTLVDRASRNALRNAVRMENN
jgi:ribonuclease HI